MDNIYVTNKQTIITMEKLELTTEDCAFVYYVLRDWSQLICPQKHANYDEQDVDKVYQIAKKFKTY